ncbi:Elongator subunit Iki1-domain-containing protein [Paraphoma chrysanthemicola]|uniref:Elongator complex protein 5 n=1 Tax=Paraphoma chrysanthemicola TaxID=798071 RepID=A0A8K0RCJ4_9PLEO|nr:Elongator subunit Iki1-domain-containing protein [Paraphoma chrysanthemicola]
MMVLSLFEIACRDWDAAFRSPEQLKHLLPNGGVLADPRDSYLGVLPPQFRALQKNGLNFTTHHGSWIKKDNFHAPSGVHKRKRKPEGRSVPDRNAMAPLNLAQHQRHYVHLMSRVLNIRTNASPFTVLLDDLNQRAMPFVSELVRRALSRNVNVVVLSFEGTRFHPAVRNIDTHGPANGDQIMSDLQTAMNPAKESLVIIDSLYELLNVEGIDMNSLFNLVAGKYASTLVGVYHQDMFPAQDSINAYAPQPLDLIKYMATSVITCKSFAHVLAAKAAKERSLPEPTHGLLQGAEGVVQCLDANDHRGIVLEAEFRRKSGRPESETYFLRAARRSDYAAPAVGLPYGILKQEFVTLLDMVPAYASKEVLGLVQFAADDMESTFNLALTEKQKQAREGVVLPYFDAQKGEGGEGGRILYDMGSEDDFDEEEDEI